MTGNETTGLDGVHRADRFGWHELNASEPEQSLAFYTGLFGWDAIQMTGGGSTERPRWELRSGDRTIGQLRPLLPGSAPSWTAYLETGGLVSALSWCVEHDATVVAPATPHPAGEGWIATVEHPAAGRFGLVEAGPHIGPGPRSRDLDVQATVISWHQLDSPDPDGATAFFAGFAGWRVVPTAVDGVGVLRSTDGAGGRDVATVTAAPGSMPAHWVPYIDVADMATTIRRAAELGGLVVVEQTLLPPVGQCCVIRDPDGLTFACYVP